VTPREASLLSRRLYKVVSKLVGVERQHEKLLASGLGVTPELSDHVKKLQKARDDFYAIRDHIQRELEK
jgi:hypothetical protein